MAFHRYCMEQGIVSEFIRFHPLYGNYLLDAEENKYVENYQPVVVADFCDQDFNPKEMVNKEAWKKIRRAERNFVEISVDYDEGSYQKFIQLYYQTMERLTALNFYYFSRDFFQAIFKDLAQFSKLFLAWHQGMMVGGLLIIYGESFSYNFLSCSDDSYANLGINDLLQWKALEWSQGQGKKRHLLGGGRKGEDSLFRFKTKFSGQTENYYIGKIVHLPDRYAGLCEGTLALGFPKDKELNQDIGFLYTAILKPIYNRSVDNQSCGAAKVFVCVQL